LIAVSASLKQATPPVHRRKATPNNERIEMRVPIHVITGPDPVIWRGTVLLWITGSRPAMTREGRPG